jgi:hypothetical protein
MNRSLTIVFGLIAGVAGGLVTRYISPPAAFAQNQAPVTTEIRAERFTLVDGRDRTVGTFMIEGAVPLFPGAGISTPATDRFPMEQKQADVRPRAIVLVDSNGREIWRAGGSLVRPLSENVR